MKIEVSEREARFRAKCRGQGEEDEMRGARRWRAQDDDDDEEEEEHDMLDDVVVE
ncbi:hypothetical protein MY3296_006966 [Beauveria thailandica]